MGLWGFSLGGSDTQISERADRVWGIGVDDQEAFRQYTWWSRASTGAKDLREAPRENRT